MRRVVAGLLLLGCWQLALGADARAAIDAIFDQLGPTDNAPRAFVEQRTNKLLSAPLTFEGEVTLQPDGTFLKVIREPFFERVLVTDDALELERGGKKRRISLQRNSGARDLYTGLRAFLQRDADTLLTVFRVTAVEPGQAWRIEFEPVAGANEKLVARMIIAGNGPDVVRIRTIQSEENWQEMIFGAGQLP